MYHFNLKGKKMKTVNVNEMHNVYIGVGYVDRIEYEVNGGGYTDNPVFQQIVDSPRTGHGGVKIAVNEIDLRDLINTADYLDEVFCEDKGNGVDFYTPEVRSWHGGVKSFVAKYGKVLPPVVRKPSVKVSFVKTDGFEFDFYADDVKAGRIVYNEGDDEPIAVEIFNHPNANASFSFVECAQWHCEKVVNNRVDGVTWIATEPQADEPSATFTCATQAASVAYQKIHAGHYHALAAGVVVGVAIKGKSYWTARANGEVSSRLTSLKDAKVFIEYQVSPQPANKLPKGEYYIVNGVLTDELPTATCATQANADEVSMTFTSSSSETRIVNGKAHPLFAVPKGYGRNRYCGPSAIAATTGITTRYAAAIAFDERKAARAAACHAYLEAERAAIRNGGVVITPVAEVAVTYTCGKPATEAVVKFTHNTDDDCRVWVDEKRVGRIKPDMKLCNDGKLRVKGYYATVKVNGKWFIRKADTMATMKSVVAELYAATDGNPPATFTCATQAADEPVIFARHSSGVDAHIVLFVIVDNEIIGRIEKKRRQPSLNYFVVADVRVRGKTYSECFGSWFQANQWVREVYAATDESTATYTCATQVQPPKRVREIVNTSV